MAAEPDRATAYARLLHLQRTCADDPSAAAPPPTSPRPPPSPCFLSSSATPPTMTRKSPPPPSSASASRSTTPSSFPPSQAICNLAVWCISVQQLEASVVEDKASTLLTAIAYALDNPFGSFSTTFEAVQEVASDLEQKLLSSMINMLNDPSKKIQAVKAWGWFVSLLGASAVSTRPLLNKILKVPEQLFTDPDPQVQITTMVMWRNLVDAFFAPQALENVDQETVLSPIEPRLGILSSIVNPELLQNMAVEMAVTIMDPTTQIFRLLLQGVRLQCNSKLADDNVAICITKFFCYPFFASSKGYLPMTQDLEAELAIEVYGSLCTNSNYCLEASYMVFLDHLFEYFIRTIDENMSSFQANIDYCLEKKFEDITILSVLGKVVIGALENAQILNYANQDVEVANEESDGCRGPNLFLSCLKLVNRFMRLSSFGLKAIPAAKHQVTNMFFSSLSTFVGHLTLAKDIVLLFEIIGDQLTEWLTLSSTLYLERQQGETIIDQLEKLWFSIVRCLTTSRLIYDCSFLQKQHPLLQVAVNHPHKPISAAATSIWRASGPGNAGLQHERCRSVSKTDELSVDRSTEDLNCASDADRTFALEELSVSRMLAPPMSSGRGVVTSNSTDRAKRNGESLRISAGLGRKRLKITKYSGKAKGLGKVTGDSFSPQWVESKVYRKPELILEMLKRKR
ncbi:hypothetical protein ACQ4PT_035117 [Festuca glaucescens]